MIGIINYGVGNINAFVNVYKKLGTDFIVANSNNDLVNISHLVLPGVGSFDHAMTKLNESGMKPRIDDLVMNKCIPIIGICVGMHLLAKSSDEGELAGLGYVDAVVRKFKETHNNDKTILPHMGWNDIAYIGNSKLFKDIQESSFFYFLHSYYFSCNKSDYCIAMAEYGGKFVSAINHGNIYGVQFHPEKSHQNGIQLLKNFSNL